MAWGSVYWVLACCKKDFIKIDKELWSLLIVGFNEHPHVIVSPNAKDELLIISADGKKIVVRTMLMQVGLGMIFSDIVRDNPTTKSKVGKWAFCYLVSRLRCV